jgi:alpha-tubulin suppressor-like RCC1 family protein
MRATITFAALAAALLGLAACQDDPTSLRPNASQSAVSRDFTIVIPKQTDFVDITAGNEHTCARQYNGYVFCWGNDEYAQIGTPSSDGRTTYTECASFNWCVIAPTYVMTASLVATGTSHTCALDLSFKAWCWGLSNQGALGLGTQISSVTPSPVSGGQTFDWIGAGSGGTCATSSGSIYCWGRIANKAMTPTFIASGGFTSISYSGWHACSVAVGGTARSVYCWGQDVSGETGQDPSLVPNPQPVMLAPFGSAVRDIATGGDFTCVDQQAGTVQCLGSNIYGQLGNGTTSVITQTPFTLQPQTVMFPPPFSPKMYTYYPKPIAAPLHGTAAGYAHACGLDANGAAYCWGSNANGQLGNGTTTDTSWPVPVSGGHTFYALASGDDHTCGIGTDNVIYCWGDNSSAQLGIGKFSGQSSTPVATAPLRWQVGP